MQKVSSLQLSEYAGKLLSLFKERGLTFGTAESCTGGLISKTVTDLSGASSVYMGSVVSYANEVKERVLAYLEKISAIIQDPSEVDRYFRAWCVISGLEYAKALTYHAQYEEPELTEETLQRLSPLKNLFGCEAHNHLIRTLLQMEYDGKLAEARATVAELEALQRMPY